MGSNSLAYIGLAYRAGKLLAGTAVCEKGIMRGKIRLLLLQEGIASGSREKFVRMCERVHIDVRTVDGLGPAIGRQGIMVAGITDPGLANTIRNIIDGGSGKA